MGALTPKGIGAATSGGGTILTAEQLLILTALVDLNPLLSISNQMMLSLSGEIVFASA